MKTLSLTEAKQIPIAEYLSRLGFEPAYTRGYDSWYHSPLREERTPSFKVNTRLNVWFDHGSGEGGTIIDLGAKLHQCSLSEFLEKLSNENLHTFSLHREPPKIHPPENKLEVLSVKELTNPDLIHYLSTRSIDLDTARSYCKEVEFRIGERVYSAIGFPNQQGAFELRNHWFKGSSSPKDFSFIDNNEKKVALLEGFIDFLSIGKIDTPEFKELVIKSDFLILNSLRLLNRILPILQDHKEINLFLDNDSPGQEAKKSLSEKGIGFNDASILYRQYKDVNEYLTAIKKIKQSNVQESEQSIKKLRKLKRSRGMRR
jgi:5S rRNA maturation endonuclease (ribonuclease M5)